MIHRCTLVFISIVFYSVLFSCKPDSTLSDVSPFAYYPLDSGKYITWTVDSVKYHDFGMVSSHFEVKEVLADTFYDDTHLLNYRIERYFRAADTLEWQLQGIWSVRYNGGKVEKSENNLRFIKLISPLSENVSWKGNAYLGGLGSIPVPEECLNLSFYENWNYDYASVGNAFSVNGFNFDSTVTVEESGSINLIEYNFSREIYAQNIGMVDREFYHFKNSSTIVCDTCNWELNAECGYSVKMHVIDFN